jgi:hypothetical protein
MTYKINISLWDARDREHRHVAQLDVPALPRLGDILNLWVHNPPRDENMGKYLGVQPYEVINTIWAIKMPYDDDATYLTDQQIATLASTTVLEEIKVCVIPISGNPNAVAPVHYKMAKDLEDWCQANNVDIRKYP